MIVHTPRPYGQYGRYGRGGLVTYCVLFVIQLGSRNIAVTGVTPHPDATWMVQTVRNMTMDEWGFLAAGQYLIHERDGSPPP